MDLCFSFLRMLISRQTFLSFCTLVVPSFRFSWQRRWGGEKGSAAEWRARRARVLVAIRSGCTVRRRATGLSVGLFRRPAGDSSVVSQKAKWATSSSGQSRTCAPPFDDVTEGNLMILIATCALSQEELSGLLHSDSSAFQLWRRSWSRSSTCILQTECAPSCPFLGASPASRPRILRTRMFR